MGIMSQKEIVDDEREALGLGTPDGYTISGGLPKADAPVDRGDTDALEAAIIEMRRKEAAGEEYSSYTPPVEEATTFYDKDDQDFLEYRAPEEPVVATPSPTIAETQTMPYAPVVDAAMDAKEAASQRRLTPRADFLNTFYVGNSLDAIKDIEGEHGPEGTLVNGNRTYNYGVEQKTLDSLGIDRNDSKFKDSAGVIDDKKVAVAVGDGFHKAIILKMPNWEEMPTEVYNSVFSLAWNVGHVGFTGYSLGTNLNTIAGSDSTEAEKNTAYLLELRTNMLDVVGNTGGKVQRGLANRRGRDYNLAASALGGSNITHYKVTRRFSEEDPTVEIGSTIKYYEGDTEVRSVLTSKTMTTSEQLKSGIKTRVTGATEDVAYVDLTNWEEAIT